MLAGINYKPKTCHATAVRINSKVNPAFMITSLKICDVNRLTIIKYIPNMIAT
jgi:hypothetical protein